MRHLTIDRNQLLPTEPDHDSAMPSMSGSPHTHPAGDDVSRAHALRATIGAILFLLCSASAVAQPPAPRRLTLGDAARLAARQGTSTAIARARESQTQARSAQRRASLMPTVSSSSRISTRTFNSAALGLDLPPTGGAPLFDPDGELMGPVRSTDLRTQVSYRLVDLPALFSWKAATVDAEAASLATAAASERAAERGATAYLRVVRADASIAARAADSSLAVELLDIARQQVTAGVGIALDVTRAESRVAEATARLIATRGDRERAMLELRRELALPDDGDVTIEDSLTLSRDEDDLPDQSVIEFGALGMRPDYQEALALVASTSSMARAARAERWPTLSVFADHGTNGRGIDRLLGTYSYGVELSVPLFDGFRTSARTAEQLGRRREAEAQALDIRRRVQTEVRSALVTMRSAREEVLAARARLTLAEQEVAQARELFRNGVNGSADVITASIALNGARDLEISALTNYHLARIALASARGMTTTLH